MVKKGKKGEWILETRFQKLVYILGVIKAVILGLYGLILLTGLLILLTGGG